MHVPIILPSYVLTLQAKLQHAGYDVYLVGGAVRDVLMGRSPQDWDIATNATPEQIQRVFCDHCFYDNHFGTVGVVVYPLDSEVHSLIVVHVTTFRSDGVYSDFRRPDSVAWGTRIEDDLLRRDFTMNAIALHVRRDVALSFFDLHSMLMWKFGDVFTLSERDYVLVDPFGGVVDICRGVIRAVGDPPSRFTEDALRMLRAVRFHAQLGFEIELGTYEAILAHAAHITHISGERIRDELWKILASDRAYEGVKLLDDCGLLQYIFPELVAGRGLDQRGHHVYDVFEHSMRALRYCPSRDPLVRLAALLHDIGKPVCFAVRNGVNTFYNHDIIGAQMVLQIARRLHFSKKDRQRLFTLVRYHMFSVDTIQTDAAIRRFIRKVGVENLSDMIDLRIGDRLGSGTQDAEGWRLQMFKKRIEQLLMPTFTVRDLAIDGHDVMRILGIGPGPQVGQVLNTLFEEVLDDPSKNRRDLLEVRIREMIS